MHSRIQHFHRWAPNRDALSEDALTVLSEVSRVSANHLELLGRSPREFNQANLDRVRRYMEIVSAE